MRAYPHVPADRDRVRDHARTVRRIEHVVKRGEHHLVPDKASVAYGHPALILKTAPGVDEHVLPYGEVSAAVGVDGRKESEPFVNGLTREFGHQRALFLRRMIRSVDLGGDLLRLSRHRTHTRGKFRALLKIKSVVHGGNVFFRRHIRSSANLFCVHYTPCTRGM